VVPGTVVSDGVIVEAPEFLEEFRSRNVGILDDKEQSALMALRVLVAGCGSVGGSAIEPLVRMGAGSLVLADPDSYETSNLNRQLCVYADVGRPKVEVAAARARAINPLIQVTEEPAGVTEENVSALLKGVGVAFDAIDSTPPSLWIKYLLHREAAKRRIPVLLGVDLGGKPIVYVWDYRRDPRPFYGKAEEADFREGREIDAVRSYLGVTAIPTDFFPVIRERAGEDPAPWPQVAYCATSMGALVSRIVIDLAVGKPVRSVVSVDVNQLPRTRARKFRHRLRWPREAVTTLRATVAAEGAFEAATESPSRDSVAPAELRPVLEAIRLAPSGHNTQPWRLEMLDERTVRIGQDRDRALPAVDPESRYVCYGIGCAIESAATIADVEWEPDLAGDPLDPGWHAGLLRVVGVGHEDFVRKLGLLGLRGTNRAPYHPHSPTAEVLESLRSAGSRGGEYEAIPLTHRLPALADLTYEAAAANLSDEAFLEELLSWIHLDRRAPGFAEDGFTSATLRLAPPVAAAMRLLKRSASARLLAVRMRLPDLMAADARATLRASGAVFALCSGDRTPHGRIESGRALLALWLAATRAGLALQPVNFALDSPLTRDAFADLAGVGREADLVALVRVGYATAAAAPSSRLPLDRLMGDQNRS
jgi:molybdopterin/thiamine biosynthesis adenylyltransferase/nitroreductase